MYEYNLHRFFYVLHAANPNIIDDENNDDDDYDDDIVFPKDINQEKGIVIRSSTKARKRRTFEHVKNAVSKTSNTLSIFYHVLLSISFMFVRIT